MISKYAPYKEEIIQLAKEHDYRPNPIAYHLSKKYNLTYSNGIRRYCKKIIIQLSQVKRELNECGVSSEDFSHGWVKTKNGSYFIKNNRLIDYDEIRDRFLDDVREYAPEYPEIKYENKYNKSLLVIDIADLHFGKMISATEIGGESNNVKNYKKSLHNKLDMLIQRTSGYDIQNIVFVGGNDVLHVDNPHNTTTSGTRQDVSMMWYDAFIEARDFYIKVLEKVIQIAPVHFVFVPSNHDYMSGFHLAQNIEAWFNKCENITFDVSPAHRKYIKYGNSLIGLTHGDGARESDLPDLMKIEAKEAYATSEHCYWYCHHIHHKDKSNYKGKQKVQLEKDYRDVKVINTGKNLSVNRTHVEYLRSASGTDSWHHRNGYQHAPQGIEGFVHDIDNGQICSLFV